ncbi:hypothetical protein O3G_MSEX001008 [Manduca sexta]|nr:hypothetical protein O3G_MSEX001008 [Manduca sexta]
MSRYSSFLDAASDCRRRAIIPDSCTNPVTASKRFETQTIYKNRNLLICNYEDTSHYL